MKRYTIILLALLFVYPFFSTAQKVKKEEASELAKIVFRKYNSGSLTTTKGIIPCSRAIASRGLMKIIP